METSTQIRSPSLMVGCMASPRAIIAFMLSGAAGVRTRKTSSLISCWPTVWKTGSFSPPDGLTMSILTRSAVACFCGCLPSVEGISLEKPELYLVNSSRSRLKKRAAGKTLLTGKSLLPPRSSDTLVFCHCSASATSPCEMLFFCMYSFSHVHLLFICLLLLLHIM